MSNVGELFKSINSSNFFSDLCQNSEYSNDQIIELAFENKEFIGTQRKIVSDDDVIRNKMAILIGQKKKNQEKVKQEDKQEPVKEEDRPTQTEFKFKPINPDKVVYLGDFAYVEQIGHRMRLVTHEYEMYY